MIDTYNRIPLIQKEQVKSLTSESVFSTETHTHTHTHTQALKGNIW